MGDGCYPPSLSFLAQGGKSRNYLNISKGNIPNPLFFDPTNPIVIDTQICQFLNATRESDLKERKKNIRTSTVTGKRKSHYSFADWEQVSENLGPTSVMSLLYRKRIQANYKDIEPLLSNYLDPQIAYDNIINIVSVLNMVHEAFIMKTLGYAEYKNIIDFQN